MTTEQFFKYAVEMCQKCSDNRCDQYETCSDCNKDFWPSPLN